MSGEGVSPPKDEPAPVDVLEAGTKVELRRMKDPYYRELPKGADVITQRMVDHFILALASASEARVEIVDGGDRFDVTEEIATVLRTAKKTKVKVAGCTFDLTHLRILSNDQRGHRVAYLADSRVVKSEPLKDIPHVQARNRLHDAEGNPFWSRTLVESSALDSAVSAQRDTFHFPEEPDSLDLGVDGQLTMKAIRDAIVPKIQKELQPVLVALRERAVAQAQSYVEREAPQYRHIIKLKRKEVESLPADLSDEKLDVELRRIQFHNDEDLRSRAAAILRTPNGSARGVAYQELVSELNAAAIDDLAKYVRDRREILNLLRKAVRQDSDGQYALEGAIHTLVVPMRATSDDIPYDQMNLWLIDERLAFHSYLASDKTFKSIAPIESQSAQRPDLMVFNRPIAFSEYPSPAFQSVVIVEFKRPMRDDYNDGENPISQVYDYIREVRAGTAEQRDGRPLVVPAPTPFYCYVVCDITKNLRKFADNASLRLGWDGQGYFGYNAPLHAYVEVISFDKLIDDAEKRNRVFFEKLGLPRG